MPLSGSDLAYLQARSGIARSGAVRANFYRPNAVITINGTNRTTKVQWGSVRVYQSRSGDVPDRASFRLIPQAAFTPTEGEIVIIGLGTSENREFAGQILRKTHERRPHNETPWIDIECIDW